MKAQLTITFEVEDRDEISQIQAEIENALYSIDCEVEDAYILNESDSDDDSFYDEERDHIFFDRDYEF